MAFGESGNNNLVVAGVLAAAFVGALIGGMFTFNMCSSKAVEADGSSTVSSAAASHEVDASSAASHASPTADASSAVANSAASTSAASDGSSAASSTAQAAASATEPVVHEAGPVRVTIPGQYVEQGFSCKVFDENIHLYADPDQSSAFARITWGAGPTRQDEIKRETLWLDSDHENGILLLAYYHDEKGLPIYGGDPEVATKGTLIIDDLGISMDELVSWIEVDTGGGFAPATVDAQQRTGEAAADSGSAANDSTGSLSRGGKAFYGVWVGASKDLAEAEALAQEVTNNGFPGEVYMTTDWSNLNSEPWYVVTAGSYDEEFNANTKCAQVISAGYDGAYVKYSGDYQG